MLPILLSYLPASGLLALIGAVVILKDRRNATHIGFSMFALSLSFWLLLLCLADLGKGGVTSLWILRLAAGIGSLFLPAFTLFVLNFPIRTAGWYKVFLALYSAPAPVFAALSLTSFMIPAVEYVNGTTQPTQIGGLYTVQTIYLFVGFILCFAGLVLKIRKSTASQKKQIIIVLVGLLTAVLANALTGFIAALLSAGGYVTNAAGSVSVLVFAILTTFALFRYKLFELRAGIIRSLAYVIALSIATLIFINSVLVVGSIFYNPLVDILRSSTETTILVVIMMLVGISFGTLNKYSARITSRIFMQDTYELKNFLEKLSSILIIERDLPRLTNQSLKLYEATLKPSYALFYIWDKKTLFSKIDLGGYNDTEFSDKIIALLARSSSKDKLVLLQNDVEDPLYETSAELLLNLYAENTVVGTIIFGPKRNGRNYSSDDLQLLKISGSNLGIGIANALKYSQIQRFAETLKSEVEVATHNLQIANDKLQALSDTKDEFVSIATHQIRPQLTASRGFVEVLEKTKVDDEQKDLLEWASTGIERSLRIITDMLNLSRFSTGTFEINKRRTDLVSLLQNELRSLSPLIKKSQISINNSTRIKSAYAEVDEIKLREVLANICNNAIQYSPDKSTVEVSLSKNANYWVVEVRDYGIGVKPSDQKRVFDKFYRSDEAKEKRAAGTGVGLFLAKTVVEGHGGKLFYKTPDGGKGSIFGFTIPVTRA